MRENYGPLDRNPYPAQAVTTFGTPITSGTTFQFMRTVLDYLVGYLTRYASTITQIVDGPVSIGGTLGLSGEHGSGKTFLLSWLRGELEAKRWGACKVAYAKADGPQFIDLYRQIIGNFTREDMQDIIRRALSSIAAQMTGAALATETTSNRIRAGVALEAIALSKELDLNEVYLALKHHIGTTGSAPALAANIAEAIGLLEDPELGKAAFEWLRGAAPESLDSRLPLAAPLFQPGLDTTIDSPDAAVNALECIAALFRLSETPLILLIDQLENFVSSTESVTGWSSVFKKLAEQTGRQSVVTVLAATHVAWERLPRDVGPRLLTREPLRVGNLTVEETTSLLASYAPRWMLPTSTIVTIHAVSGGNPREILQITYRCFNRAEGEPSRVDDGIVFEAANDSGTLKDRETLALQEMDRVLARRGLMTHDLRLHGGLYKGRLIDGPYNRSIAILLAVARDALDEVETAKSLATTRAELAASPGRTEMLVVAVGYTSQRVQALVRAISHLIPFGGQFEAGLDDALSMWLLSTRGTPPEEGPGLATVLERIDSLQRGLADLRDIRAREATETSVRLSQTTAELARPALAEREARTRWELLEGLDKLRDAVDSGDQGSTIQRILENIREERALLRSLLVANEANVKDRAFDFLGGLYIDLLDAEASCLGATEPETSRDKSRVLRDVRRLRGTIIGQVRQSLLLDHKRFGAYLDRIVYSGLAALTGSGFVSILAYGPLGLRLPEFMRGAIVLVAFAGTASATFIGITVLREPQLRYRFVARRVLKLQELVETV